MSQCSWEQRERARRTPTSPSLRDALITATYIYLGFIIRVDALVAINVNNRLDKFRSSGHKGLYEMPGKNQTIIANQIAQIASLERFEEVSKWLGSDRWGETNGAFLVRTKTVTLVLVIVIS